MGRKNTSRSSEIQAFNRVIFTYFRPMTRLNDVKQRIIALGERWGWAYTGKPKGGFQRLISRLHPELTDIPLIRLGGAHDGGYLVPDDLDGVHALFSPGVADSSEFERACLERGMQVYMADASVPGPASGLADLPGVHFTQQFVGAHGRPDRLAMDEWVASAGLSPDADLMGQIDIEGAEYELLLNASTTLLSRFRVLVIEFHDVELWAHPGMRQFVEAALDRLLVTHRVVHAHPNNYLQLKRMRGVAVPPLIELTFHRRDRAASTGWAATFPHPEDADNVPGRPAVVLPRNWWGGPER